MKKAIICALITIIVGTTSTILIYHNMKTKNGIEKPKNIIEETIISEPEITPEETPIIEVSEDVLTEDNNNDVQTETTQEEPIFIVSEDVKPQENDNSTDDESEDDNEDDDRLEKEKTEAERLKAEQIAAEKAKAERKAEEALKEAEEAQRLAEEARIASEKAEQEAREQAEREEQERLQAEAERLAREAAEAEEARRIAEEEARRAEEERIAALEAQKQYLRDEIATKQARYTVVLARKNELFDWYNNEYLPTVDDYTNKIYRNTGVVQLQLRAALNQYKNDNASLVEELNSLSEEFVQLDLEIERLQNELAALN